jgi:hypothetical protein
VQLKVTLRQPSSTIVRAREGSASLLAHAHENGLTALKGDKNDDNNRQIA